MATIKNLCLKIIICLHLNYAFSDVMDTYISTSEESNTNAIEGFGTDLQCLVSTCLTGNQKVIWYKNEIAITDLMPSLRDRISVRHNVILDPNKDCTGKCSNRQDCPPNHYCLEPSCCQCNGEEFTLVITNLSLADSGIYKCVLEPDNKSIGIRLNVMESGTFPTFNQNLTFDHSKCCEDQRMSADCLPMCKPSVLETHKFDPVPCQKEFSKLLNCATIGGNVSHIHCCRLSFVPPFCWEFCSGRTTNFQKSNRLCVYWMPEIFQCYEQAYLPYPGPPEQLVVNPVNSTSLEVCWEEPKIRGDSVRFYSVRYQEVPRFPFLGGAIPFLTGDGDGPTDGEVTETPVDEEIPSLRPLILPTSSPARLDNRFFGRKKRQALIVSTHNFATNETEIREFKYLETNTSETCETLINLKPSTQYFVYVTATNNFGTSLPSLRQTAVTEAAVYPNSTLPNIKECCLRNGVGMKCVSKMCDVENPPTSAGAFNLAFDCQKEFTKVAPCLADGRDHSECCREKNVGGECLKLCDASANQLGMSSVFCLSLDIQSIYSCYREGYIHLPSPPTNLTVLRTSSSSVDVSWGSPTTNNEKIVSYSLFYKISYAEEYIEVENARSPFTLVSLQPDTSYNLYVIARSSQGSSLKSTVVRFITSDKEFASVCPFGKPLKDAFDQDVICGDRVPCPALFKCVDSETDDSDKMFCCPTESFVSETNKFSTPNMTACCSAKGVPQECLKLCSYNVTVDDLVLMGPSCHEHLKTFVDCGGDGRNDRPCCLKAGIPEGICLDFCEPPLEHVLSDYMPCAIHAERIIKCGLEGVLTLPGRPRSLKVEDSGQSFVTLFWESPSQTVPVLNYEVRLFGSKWNVPISLNTTGLSLTIPDLTPNEQYVAHVIAWNGRGSSMPGENVTFLLGKRGVAVNPDDDYKPRPPTRVEKVWYKEGSSNISWIWTNTSVTGKPIEKFMFRVMYKTHIADKQPSPPWQQINSTKKFAILTSLSPGMTYDVQIYALNTLKNVESLPSEMINILAQEIKIAPFAEFSTDPNTDFTAGDRVTVYCKGSGDPEPFLSMEMGGKLLSNGSGTISYTFKNIKFEDGLNPIFCTADNGGVPSRHRTVLKVRYAPIVTSYVSHVTAIQDLSTKLVCRIQGYPKPQIEWYFISDDSFKKSRSPYVISESNNRLINSEATEQENTFNASLKLTGTQPNDAGYYYCKAKNELGASNASFYLIVEPFPVPKGPNYLLTCCQQQNVLPECLSACTNLIDPNQYEQNPQCVGEIPKLFFCARDGVDNSRCCALSGVPEKCLPNCNGMSYGLGDSIDAQHCSNYRSQIVTCVQDRHKYVSGPPEELNVSVLDSGKVNVTWKPPLVNNEAIQMYVVYYKKTGEQNYTEVRTPYTHVLINGLEPEYFYNFTVISVNHFGFSTFVPIIEKRISLNDDSYRFRGLPKLLSGTSNVAGTILGVIFCLLLAAVIVLAVVYFTRRPYKLPAFILKLRSRASPHMSSPIDSVAFENPGYDREGQVRGLPGDGSTLNGYAVAPSNGDVGWEHPRLETPDDSPAPEQRGMRYTQLT